MARVGSADPLTCYFHFKSDKCAVCVLRPYRYTEAHICSRKTTPNPRAWVLLLYPPPQDGQMFHLSLFLFGFCISGQCSLVTQIRWVAKKASGSTTFYAMFWLLCVQPGMCRCASRQRNVRSLWTGDICPPMWMLGFQPKEKGRDNRGEKAL